MGRKERRNGDNLIARVMISEGIEGILNSFFSFSMKFHRAMLTFRRGEQAESSNGRVPQKREMVMNGEAEDAIVRGNTQKGIDIQNIRDAD